MAIRPRFVEVCCWGSAAAAEDVAGVAGRARRGSRTTPGLETPKNQRPCQEPKLEVPTIYKAYFSGLNFREHPHKIWSNIWYVYVPPSVGSRRSPMGFHGDSMGVDRNFGGKREDLRFHPTHMMDLKFYV
jgi:hypothetical protein